MEFVKTARGNHKLFCDGYVYVKQKDLKDGVVSYECEQRRNKSACKAKVKVHDGKIVGRVNEHTHAPDAAQHEVASAIQSIRSLAQSSQEPPQRIISQSLSGLSDDARSKLPTISNIRRNVTRYRQVVESPLSVPTTIEQVIIPEDLRKTNDGEDFLLFDSGAAEVNRILIFGTQSKLQLLENCPHWFVDGTFKTAPMLFFQLYTIHALLNETSIVCVYALLQSKTQEMYASLFNTLMTLNPNFNPQSIMMDFELAAINVLKTRFPEADIHGCFFHFTQNIYRKIQQVGLQQRCQNDPNFAVQLRMLVALAFVPTDEVISAFEAICDLLPSDATPLIDYFENTYIGQIERRGRREPIFPIKMWNMYQRCVDELPKTNNFVEGWHRSFQCMVGGHRPTIWKFIKFLQKDQAIQHLKYTQIVSGHSSHPSKKKYTDLNGRILNIVRDYRKWHIPEYLRGIAFNLSF